MVELESKSVAFFASTQAASYSCLHLAFPVLFVGREADYYLLSGIIPTVADCTYSAAGQVDHIDFVDHAAFMRVKPDASHAHMDRCS